MSDAPLEFDCPVCAGAFEIGAEWLGHEVQCPHCGEEVLLEAPPDEEQDQPIAEPPPADEPTSDSAKLIEAQPAPEPQPEPPPRSEPKPAPRPLTQQERAALKRRVNLVLATLGAVLLIATFLALSWLTG